MLKEKWRKHELNFLYSVKVERKVYKMQTSVTLVTCWHSPVQQRLDWNALLCSFMNYFCILLRVYFVQVKREYIWIIVYNENEQLLPIQMVLGCKTHDPLLFAMLSKANGICSPSASWGLQAANPWPTFCLQNDFFSIVSLSLLLCRGWSTISSDRRQQEPEFKILLFEENKKYSFCS